MPGRSSGIGFVPVILFTMAFACAIAASMDGLAVRFEGVLTNARKRWSGIRKGGYLGAHGYHRMEVLADGVFKGLVVMTIFWVQCAPMRL